MALKDILLTSNKKAVDMDDDAIKEHVRGHLEEYQKVIAY